MVVVAGATEADPDACTAPIPWSMLIDVALVTVHDKVVVWSAVIVDGLAAN